MILLRLAFLIWLFFDDTLICYFNGVKSLASAASKYSLKNKNRNRKPANKNKAKDSSLDRQQEQKQQQQITFDKILKEISVYGVDSHVNVVLVGSAFDQNSADIITEALETLVRKSKTLSPFTYVHENNHFHVELDKGLESGLKAYANLLNNTEVEPSEIEQLLSKYHHRSSSSTTLFVLYGIFDHRHHYPSLSKPACPQRAFISTDDYAWIDLTVSAEILVSTLPVDSVVYPAFSTDDVYNKWHKLAAIVYSSWEALNPLSNENKISYKAQRSPLMTNRNNEKKGSSSIHDSINSKGNRALHIRVVSLCVDIFVEAGGGCHPSSLLNVLNTLVDQYSGNSDAESASSAVDVTYSVVSFSLAQEAQLRHALFHSLAGEISADETHFPKNGPKMLKITTSELIFWLGSCQLFQTMVENMLHIDDSGGGGQQRAVLLPVFVLQNPDTAKHVFYLDEPYTLVQAGSLPLTPFDMRKSKNSSSSSSSSKEDGIEAAASEKHYFEWPSTAVVVVQNAAPATYAHESIFNSELRCGYSSHLPSSATNHISTGVLLSVGAWFKDEKLFYFLRQLVWGLPPPYLHYSALSQRVSADFLWYTTVATCPPGHVISNSSEQSACKGVRSFRERRAVRRVEFFARAEELVAAMHASLRALQREAPNLDVSTFLLSLNNEDKKGENPKEIDTKSNSKVNANAKTKAKAKANEPKVDPFIARMAGKLDLQDAKAAVARDGGSILGWYSVHMQEAAKHFSHLDYTKAWKSLDATEAQVARVVTMVQERSLFEDLHSVVTCLATDSDGFEDGEGDGDGEEAERVREGEGSRRRKQKRTSSYSSSSSSSSWENDTRLFWVVLYVVSIVGVISGMVAGISAVRQELPLDSFEIPTVFSLKKSSRGLLG